MDWFAFFKDGTIIDASSLLSSPFIPRDDVLLKSP